MTALQGLVPPHDLQAEVTVLAALVWRPDDLEECREIVEPSAFYAEANRFVYEAMLTLVVEQRPVDLVTIATKLKEQRRLDAAGGSAYLTQLELTPSVINWQEHARVIADRYRARQYIAVMQKATVELFHEPARSSEIIERVSSNAHDLVLDRRQDPLEPISAVLGRELHKLSGASKEVVEPAVSTGFSNVNRALGGGFYPGDLVIVAGRPGMGKSAFMNNLVVGCSRPRGGEAPGGASAIFSLEMSREQVVLRLVAAEAEVPYDRLRKRELTKGDWVKVTEVAARMSRWPIFVDDTPALALTDMQSRVRWLKRQVESGKYAETHPSTGLREVAVDYLQLMRGERSRNGNREQEVSSISQGLKALAKEVKAPVLALSQLNRSTEKSSKTKRPQLSDLRESGALEQDADIVLFLYREAYYEQDSTSRDAELIIAKQRNGPPGRQDLTYRGELLRFYSPTDYGEMPSMDREAMWGGFEDGTHGMPNDGVDE